MIDILSRIQVQLNAPKNQRNNFGKYNYRSCEDILEALKPILAGEKCAVNISDKIVEIGGRVYVEATAAIHHGEFSVSTKAYAREPESKKGMDPMQITGATSSYARKYALNGLFAIDDNKDADSMDNREVQPEAQPEPTDSNERYEAMLYDIQKGKLIAWCKDNDVNMDSLGVFIKAKYGCKLQNIDPEKLLNVVEVVNSEFFDYMEGEKND